MSDDLISLSARGDRRVQVFKRFRSRNFNSSEKALLQQILNSFGAGGRLLQSSQVGEPTGSGSHKKIKYKHQDKIKWQEVANSFNQRTRGTPHRSARQLRSLWSGMLRTIRRFYKGSSRELSKMASQSAAPDALKIVKKEAMLPGFPEVGDGSSTKMKEMTVNLVPLEAEFRNDNTVEPVKTAVTEMERNDGHTVSYSSLSPVNPLDVASPSPGKTNNNLMWKSTSNTWSSGQSLDVKDQIPSSVNMVDSDNMQCPVNMLATLAPLTAARAVSPVAVTQQILSQDHSSAAASAGNSMSTGDDALDLRHPGKITSNNEFSRPHPASLSPKDLKDHTDSQRHVEGKSSHQAPLLKAKEIIKQQQTASTSQNNLDAIPSTSHQQNKVNSADLQSELLMMSRVEHSTTMELLQLLAQQAQEQHSAQMTLLQHRYAQMESALAQSSQYPQHVPATTTTDGTAAMAAWQQNNTW